MNKLSLIVAVFSRISLFIIAGAIPFAVAVVILYIFRDHVKRAINAVNDYFLGGDTVLTKDQLARFKRSYIDNELETIFYCMDSDMRLDLFGTEDEREIIVMLDRSISGIVTVEELRDAFDDFYDDIL